MAELKSVLFQCHPRDTMLALGVSYCEPGLSDTMIGGNDNDEHIVHVLVKHEVVNIGHETGFTGER